VTVGITPRYPETGYGYIRAGDPLDLPGSTRAYRVAEFKEKPDIETATRYVREGSYLWNASMFVWQAGTLMAEIERFLPELHDALQRIVDAWDTPRREETLARIWPTVTDVSIDHGILERSDRVDVVPGTFGWSDLGDWHGVGTILQNGDDSNVVIGCEAVTSHARNAVIVGNQRTVAVVGIDNIVVVDTPDALLVCERSRAQDVRGIVAQLRQRGALDLI
jgi:mannose-1-phosphate guanylyltransferase